MEAGPMSPISNYDKSPRREKAEQALESLVQILATPAVLTKFTTALPLSRVLLLLLGEHPSSVVASQILILLGLVLYNSQSFNRKFELVSGWMVLRTVLPSAWDPSVHVAAFDLLLGRVYIAGNPQTTGPPRIACPYILPTILASLHYGLERVVTKAQLPEPFMNGHASINGVMSGFPSSSPTSMQVEQNQNVSSAMEVLLEELIDLHSSTPSFRQLFKSKQTTSLFISACRSYVMQMAQAPQLWTKLGRLMEKVSHLTLMLAMDEAVDNNQKREVSRQSAIYRR